MDIPAITLDIIQRWANVNAVPDLAVELCVLFVLGRHVPCDSGARQNLIDRLRNGLAGIVNLQSLRPSDLIEPGSIKTVLLLHQFIAANIIPD